MKRNEDIVYEEKFFFRTRTHTLTPLGIRTRQSSFFYSSDTLTPFERLGNFLQYQSDLKLSELFFCLALLVLGIQGWAKSARTGDGFAFALGTVFCAPAIYWIVHALFNLEHIGSFYFSHTVEKPKGGFEIKSRYPASKELEAFLEQIKWRQKEMLFENLIQYIDHESILEGLENEARRLKKVFSIDDNEFEGLLNGIREAYARKTEQA